MRGGASSNGEGAGETDGTAESELVAELRLHQLELEVQNQELISARDELERSRARYLALYDFAPVAFFGVDSNTIIHEANLTGATLLGITRERLLGHPLGRYVSAEHSCDFRHRIGRCIRTGAPESMSVVFELKEGKTADVQLQMSSYDDAEGGRQLCRLAASDISPLVRSQRELHGVRERLQVAQRMAALGTLAAGVGHEINNPLAFVLSNIERALRDVKASSGPPSAMLALESACEGVGRIRDIIRDLSAFCRPERGKPTPVYVEDVLEASLKMAMNQVRHRATVVRELEPVAPVVADVHQLQQVFLNLLVNAAQAIPIGAAGSNTISVRTRMEGSASVVVEIEDTGVGMSPEVMVRVFEPFFTTKAVGEGTGLGLAISFGIVESLGGRLTVESKVGRGSVFRVVLPPSREPLLAKLDNQPTASGRTTALSGRRSIMLIDDQPNYARSLSLLLSDRYDVTEFTSADEALCKLSTGQRFDAIVCDLMMPITTGKDFYARVPPEVARRIIFMTGGAFTETMREFLEKVSNPRLEKPFPISELEAQLESMMGGSSQVSPLE